MHHRLTRALLLFTLALCLLPAPGAGLAAADLRLAVLDVDRVRHNAVAVQGIRSQLSSYLDVYRTDTQKEEQQIRTAQEELTAKRAKLSADAFTEERKKLEGRIADAQARVQKRRQALERVNLEAMQQVQQALEGIVTELAAERQLSLILRKDQTVFNDASFDITDEVLRRLDQRLPSVRISDPGG